MITTEDRDVRQPDFSDQVSHTHVWIGPDAAVEIPWEQAERIERLFMNAGWYARVGMVPEHFGIEVTRFSPDFIHPGTGVLELKGEGDHIHTIWRVIVDALDAAIVTE